MRCDVEGGVAKRDYIFRIRRKNRIYKLSRRRRRNHVSRDERDHDNVVAATTIILYLYVLVCVYIVTDGVS